MRARAVIGADGAKSQVARQDVPGADRMRFVFAYHEIVKAPQDGEAGYDPARCDVIYRGKFSPDFYSWVFPHGETASIGTGSMNKGFSLRGSDRRPAPGDRPRRLRDHPPRGRADPAQAAAQAGTMAATWCWPATPPASWRPPRARASTTPCWAASSPPRPSTSFLATGDARALAGARRQFMKAHGRVFWILGIMQRFWYANDMRRERFVKICRDKDVQQLTFESYMNKELVRKKPMAHVRIFFKDMAHLLGLVRA